MLVLRPGETATLANLVGVDLTSPAEDDVAVWNSSGDLVNVAPASSPFVALSGDQTVAGDKTFSDEVTIGDVLLPTADGDQGAVMTTDGDGTASWSHVEVDTCRLNYSSATQLILFGLGDGGGTLNIDGAMARWTSNPTLSNGSLSTNTTYYIYAYLSSGTVTLEASTTAPVSQVDGQYTYKTGDATRRYVGKCRTNGSSQFSSDKVFTAVGRRVSLGIEFCARLSLSNTLAVPTANITAATSVYLHPYRGRVISVYNTTAANWEDLILDSAISVAVPATTTTPFDIFVYDVGGGTLTLEVVNWTNDTTRATALTTQNGVYVKTGETGKRYVGTGRTTGVSGQCEWSPVGNGPQKLFLWNYYHRMPVGVQVTDTTATWEYTTATIRQARASAANQIEIVVGVQESWVEFSLHVISTNGAGEDRRSGIGYDSTSAFSGIIGVSSGIVPNQACSAYRVIPAAGYHYIAWLEWSTASDTTTWASVDSGHTVSGLHGTIHA